MRLSQEGCSKAASLLKIADYGGARIIAREAETPLEPPEQSAADPETRYRSSCAQADTSLQSPFKGKLPPLARWELPFVVFFFPFPVSRSPYSFGRGIGIRGSKTQPLAVTPRRKSSASPLRFPAAPSGTMGSSRGSSPGGCRPSCWSRRRRQSDCRNRARDRPAP